MDIKDFLLARVAEDEALAKKGRPNNTGLEVLEIDDYGTEALGISEARALAECAAKRAIMDAHPIVHDVVEVSTRIKWGFACETCFSYGDTVEDHGYCDTLRALATIYADHHDFRREWAA